MNSARILNVDDDDASRYVTTHALLRAGFEVDEAVTGREALEKAENRPDLILLDVNLPDISGLEVCRRIKADPRYNSLAVLHISATSTASHDRSQGLEGGADGYLVEPIEARELVATVQAAIRVRRAEEAARAAAERWEATFEAISDGVCLVDSRGAIHCCNSALCQELALSREEMLSRSVWELFRERLGLEVAGLGERLSTDDIRWSEDVEGRDRWFRLMASPVAETGELAGAVLVLEDITARKELERALQHRADELAESDRQKDEFLAMLGHELRNPLGAITNGVALLHAGSTNPATIQRAADIIKRQTAHLSRLVEDLLDMTRIAQGIIELRKAPTDLASVVTGAVETALPLIESQHHRLAIIAAPETLMVNADPVRLAQAVANLLNNSAKFTEPGGEISLKTWRDGREAVISVRDSGKGIPAEMLPKVFDLFTQADPGADRSRGGLGLGLTLVHRLVALHGGRIECKSEGAGMGSEFTIRLPLLD